MSGLPPAIRRAVSLEWITRSIARGTVLTSVEGQKTAAIKVEDEGHSACTPCERGEFGEVNQSRV